MDSRLREDRHQETRSLRGVSRAPCSGAGWGQGHAGSAPATSVARVSRQFNLLMMPPFSHLKSENKNAYFTVLGGLNERMLLKHSVT